MTTLLQISPVLSAQLQKFAAVEGVTVEEFLLLAAAEKIAHMEHRQWLRHKQPARADDPCGKD